MVDDFKIRAPKVIAERLQFISLLKVDFLCIYLIADCIEKSTKG